MLYTTPENAPFVYWTEDVLAEVLYHLRREHADWDLSTRSTWACELSTRRQLFTVTVNNVAEVNSRARRVLHAVLAGHQGSALTVSDALDGSGRLIVDYGRGLRAGLVPVWAGEGFPRDVAAAIRDLDYSNSTAGATPVVVARRLSPGAREWLDERRVSWADEAGHARIAAEPGLYVLLDKHRPLDREETPRSHHWSEASGAIAEAVLTRVANPNLAPDRRTTLPAVTDLAHELGLSAGLVSRTLRAFDAEGWTRKHGPERGATSRREVVAPGELLSGWAAWYRTWRRPTALAHGLVGDPDALVDRLVREWAGHWWALTGSILLERRAPFLTSTPTVDLYLERQAFADPNMLHRLLERAGLRLVDSGARVHVFQADEYLERLVPQRLRGGSEVGDIRLYGDLLRSGVRGEDAAEHLRETRIGF